MLSAIIVTHNSGATLPACLASLKADGLTAALRIFAVDNASVDDSVELLRRCRANVVALGFNAGFAAAVNRAMRKVETPLALLLNPDIVCLNGGIARMVEAASAHPDVPAFGGRNVFADGTINPANAWGAITPRSALLRASGLSAMRPGSKCLNPEALPDWDRLSDRTVDVATGCALLVRTDLFRMSGGFDERYWLYGEEAEWQGRLARMGHPRPRIVADAVFVHGNGAASEAGPSGDLRTERILRGRATIMRHGWPPRWRPLAGPLLWLEAIRHGAQALIGSHFRNRHAHLWRTRREWIAGYPEPERDGLPTSRHAV